MQNLVNRFRFITPLLQFRVKHVTSFIMNKTENLHSNVSLPVFLEYYNIQFSLRGAHDQVRLQHVAHRCRVVPHRGYQLSICTG